MSAGPLKRLCSSTSDILEDGDLIPWTFVSPQADQSDNEATTYTTEGSANKRRRVLKKKKSKVEVKSTSEADSNAEWTDEEEYSLCQVVAISMQNASGSQSNLDMVEEIHSTPHRSHGDLAEALLAKNVTKELQSVSVSQILAECFIPTHGPSEVVARVKSGAFRRKFLGFLRSKNEQNKRLLTGIKPEELEVISCEVGSSDNARDELQDEKSQKSSSTLRESLCAKRSNTKFKQEKQSQIGESKRIASGETDPNCADRDKECISECSSRPPVKQTLLRLKDKSSSKEDAHVGEKHQASKRTSSRLKKKQSTDADTDSDKLNSSHLSTNLAEDESNRSLDSIKKGQESRHNDRNEQQEDVPSEILIPAQEGSRTGPRLERNVRTVRMANSKSVSHTLPVPDNSGRRRENVRLGKQQRSTECNAAVKQPVKTNGVQHGDGHEASQHHVTAPNLAAISPSVRHSKPNVKENEKRSFKAFRKKLLDKSLEVQQNGLMLTASFKPPGCSENTKASEGLDKYLMLQKVQENRKNILDACLMGQRDTTS